MCIYQSLQKKEDAFRKLQDCGTNNDQENARLGISWLRNTFVIATGDAELCRSIWAAFSENRVPLSIYLMRKYSPGLGLIIKNIKQLGKNFTFLHSQCRYCGIETKDKYCQLCQIYAENGEIAVRREATKLVLCRIMTQYQQVPSTGKRHPDHITESTLEQNISNLADKFKWMGRMDIFSIPFNH